MLKKYTKHVTTAFAVASLSMFMIGCGADEGAVDPDLIEPGDTNAPAGEEGEPAAPPDGE